MDFNMKDNEVVEMDMEEEDFEIPFDNFDEEVEEEEENLMDGIESEVEQYYQAYHEDGSTDLSDLDREQLKKIIFMKRQTLAAIESKILAATADAYIEGMRYVRDNEI